MSGRTKVVSLVLLTALLGGSIPVFIKIALVEIPPFTFTLTRFVVATAVLLPFYLRVRKPIGRDRLKVIFVSLLGMGNVVLAAFGIQRTSAGVAQALYTLSPVLTVLFSALLLRVAVSREKSIGVAVGFAGTLIITFLPFLENGSGTTTLPGNALIILAIVCVTLYTLYSKPLQRTYHPVEITTFFCIATVATLLPLSFTDAIAPHQWWRSVSTEAIASVVYVGVVGTAAYFLLTQYVVQHAESILASMVLYVQPFVTILWAYLLLHETVSPYFIAGIALTLAGVWLATHQNTRSS